MTNVDPTCRVDSLSSFCDFRATVDVLRLDLLHPVVSGNKWFKLRNYLIKAGEKTILTFGGAYSNHIVATAAAANESGKTCIGIIRGEEPERYSPSLLQAREFGMKLFFTSREAYRHHLIPDDVYKHVLKENLFIIPEGGYGKEGMEGAKDILLNQHTDHCTHIVTAVGTGTTLAGLVAAAGKKQQVIGVSVLKNNYAVVEDCQRLLADEPNQSFRIVHDYHFGGYAKHKPLLFDFMNRLYAATNVPTDFVYTGKAFYAVFDLLNMGFFATEDKILLIHTGGLQGNRSLPKGTLIFE